jgi:hypothetical protein
MKFIPRFSVEMAMEDVLYLSYLIVVEQVRSFVPTILRLAEVAEGKVFISIVALRCHDVRLSIGFFNVSGKTLRFEAHHSKMMPHSGTLSRIKIPFLTSSALMSTKEMEEPHHLLLAPFEKYYVSMPPERIG